VHVILSLSSPRATPCCEEEATPSGSTEESRIEPATEGKLFQVLVDAISGVDAIPIIDWRQTLLAMSLNRYQERARGSHSVGTGHTVISSVSHKM
jgi:hypothetical protein